jgi:hypothetical protein
MEEGQILKELFFVELIRRLEQVNIVFGGEVAFIFLQVFCKLIERLLFQHIPGFKQFFHFYLPTISLYSDLEIIK